LRRVVVKKEQRRKAEDLRKKKFRLPQEPRENEA
jgi:hypothetical protein